MKIMLHVLCCGPGNMQQVSLRVAPRVILTPSSVLQLALPGSQCTPPGPADVLLLAFRTFCVCWL